MNHDLDFYHHQAKSVASPLPWVAALQNKGWQSFAHYGFPSLKQEDWRYTNLEPFKQIQFTLPNFEEQTVVDRIDGPMPPHVMLHNGYFLKNSKHALPSQMLIMPLFQAMREHADKIKPYLDRVLQREHGFHALNSACLHAGVFIYLPKGTIVEEPLVVSHYQTTSSSIPLRHFILMEEGSRACIIEEYKGQDACCYFMNTITEVVLQNDASLTHYKIQCESEKAYHMGEMAVSQAQGSQFTHHSFAFGSKLMRSDLQVHLHALNANCLLNGIYMPKKGAHMDHHTAVNHLAPNCTSEQDYKGIIAGGARAVFNGKIVVAKHAQQTQAKQQNKNLLLAPQAEIDTKPQLEIFADDVSCTHGATVGQLDEQALFYLKTRGIDEKEARDMLVQAFAATNLQFISHPSLAKWLRTFINRQLG